MMPLPTWLDNPIFVKHVRSRLRIQSFAASAVVVVVLCMCIAWAGQYLSWFESGMAFGVLLSLQGILLVIMGAAQVGSSISGARASGILDFHRVSPVSPTALTLGFYFGGPVREYLLFACTLPFSVFCLAMGPPTLSGFVQIMLVLFLTAWIAHALALLSGLVTRKPKVMGQGGVVGLIFLGLFISSPLYTALSHAADFAIESPWFSFYGVKFPWVVVALFYEVPILSFLLVASNRKMASERAHVLSKPQAAGCLATVAFLQLGGLWGQSEHVDGPILVLVVLYTMVVFGLILASAVTPTAGEYAKGLRRAAKLGRARLGAWNDLALNRIALIAMCVTVLAGATVARSVLGGQNPMRVGLREVDFSLTIAIAVIVVAYIGLAVQYFRLAFPKRAALYFGLFLFMVWVVPMVLGTIVLASSGPGGPGEEDALGQVLLSSSPVTGIALSTGIAHGTALTAVRAAAFCPALVFALVFNNLVTMARRRIEREVRDQGAKPWSEPPLYDLEKDSLLTVTSGG